MKCLIEGQLPEKLPHHLARTLAAGALLAAAVAVLLALRAGTTYGALALASGAALAAASGPRLASRAVRDLATLTYYLAAACVHVGLRAGYVALGFLLLEACLAGGGDRLLAVLRHAVFGAWAALASLALLRAFGTALGLVPQVPRSWTPAPEEPARGVVPAATGAARLAVTVASVIAFHLLAAGYLAAHTGMMALSGGGLMLLVLFFTKTTARAVYHAAFFYAQALQAFAGALGVASWFTAGALLVVSALKGRAAEGLGLAGVLLVVAFPVYFAILYVSVFLETFLGQWVYDTYLKPPYPTYEPQPIPDREPRKIPAAPPGALRRAR